MLFATQPLKIWIRNFKTNLTPVKLAYNVYEGTNTDKTLPPLIVMHGLLGSKQNWRGICRELQTKIKQRIYAVDARNHGESPHIHAHSSANLAEDVAEFIRQQGYAKASVMGHSMGGRAMMYLALQHPDLVERGIIIDISPISVPRGISDMENILLAMKNISVPKELSMAHGRRMAEKELKTSIDPDTVSFIILNFKKRKTGEFYWACNVDALLHNLRKFSEFMEHIDQKPFTKPMLFACGKDSAFMDPGSWPEIKKIFPNSELDWLDSGHMVHIEQPVKFVTIVGQFLNKPI
ncbi:protein ABHD11-like isoform X2 [Teleopsis dalmanni]|uniref:protein ABHD11-like n=1 Tax=Teleopsis dalmanni TaxID=139649 RepID=UPI0018CF13DC|nr:protein ABHD11-like [Teleopsis dalmanni]XP_037957026.1 protein ABHD11-like isoform X2 [Teleopsis dalmanni]XP_037957027.1 protein ABHD11-like isoform X2 [Teleopsis dalmanni]